jgi:hypothetical protein
MPRRNSPNDIQDLGDLSRLGELVVDKRLGQRANAKKSRRNRHYEKQFIRNTLAHRPVGTNASTADGTDDGTHPPSPAAPGEAAELP